MRDTSAALSFSPFKPSRIGFVGWDWWRLGETNHVCCEWLLVLNETVITWTHNGENVVIAYFVMWVRLYTCKENNDLCQEFLIYFLNSLNLVSRLKRCSYLFNRRSRGGQSILKSNLVLIIYAFVKFTCTSQTGLNR